MNFEQLFAQGLNLVGAFTPRIALLIFMLCFIGEGFIISIPFVYETVWLVAGYQLVSGVLPIPDLILLGVTAQLGRQAGALVLYFLSRRGTTFFAKFIARRLPRKDPEEGTPLKILKKIDKISPFGVALGRLLWLRIPLTLLLGARRRLKTLMVGIVISGFIYEAVYVGLGAVVGTAKPDSSEVLIYFVAGLALLYSITFGVRLIFKAAKGRREVKETAL